MSTEVTDNGVPMTVTDEQIKRFKAIDVMVVGIKEVLKIAQINAQEELVRVSLEKKQIWLELSNQYGFNPGGAWQVSYTDKVIIPGIQKIKG